jgi:hypothetical protein
MSNRNLFNSCSVAIILFALMIGTLQAQSTSYATIEQAATDPYVIDLIGKDSLDRLVVAQREKATQNRASAILSKGANRALELGFTADAMAECFAEQRWDAGRDEFDAKSFLSAIRKLQLLEKNTNNRILKPALTSALKRLDYKLNRSPIQFWLEWNLKQLESSGNSAATKQILDRDFFVVPYACKDLLTAQSQQKYSECHQLLLKLSGNASGGKLGDGSGFAAMSSAAEKEALAWYENHRQTFEASVSKQASEFRLKFFKDNIQSQLYVAGRKRITKILSKAKSEFNEANNGLKYAEINSKKAHDSAIKGDAANAKSYLTDARENGIELAAATNRLAELLLEANEVRKYMLGEAAVRTRFENIGDFDLPQLKQLLANAPSGGNANTVAKNTLSEMISLTQRIAQAEQWLSQANANCERIDDALRVGEEATAKLTRISAATAASPFDVSSREAFEASKEKLSTSIPTEDFVAFTQAWVKILQAAIKKDPMVMADDAKYMEFLKENFEGKTVADFIDK